MFLMQSITFIIPIWLSYIIATMAVVYLLSQLLLVTLYCISWSLGRKIKKLQKSYDSGPFKKLSGILLSEERLTQKQKEKLKEEWQNRYKGTIKH